MNTPTYDQLKEWDHAHVWHPFTQMQDWLKEEPVIIAKGEGNYLIDTNGKRYLDGVSSLWCNVHGHAHPKINRAIATQVKDIAHSTTLGLSNIPSIQLAKRLVELTPAGLERVFYSDAGATATEIALKMAFQYWQLRKETRRTKFASLVEAYHGDTLGAVSVGYSELFHHFYRPLLTDTIRLTPPHIFRFERGLTPEKALAEAQQEAREKLTLHRNELAALIIEPLMQGAAGMWAHSVEYFKTLRQETKEHGILLICDEVATGFGRTGKMFACEHAGVEPDLLCLAKGITGGYLPLAATLTTDAIFSAFLAPYEDFRTFFHGHTYTGNPVACAAALASLDVFAEENVIDQLQPKIKLLKDHLQSDIAPLEHVADVRQWGTMVGIELMQDPSRKIPYPPRDKIGALVTQTARNRGIMIRPLGNIIILMPPLSVTADQLLELLDTVHDAIEEET